MKIKVNNNIKLKSGGRLINTPDGLDVTGLSGVLAGENLVVGDTLKLTLQTDGSYKAKKVNGIKQSSSNTYRNVSYYNTNGIYVMALSESLVIASWVNSNQGNAYNRSIVAITVSNGTYTFGAVKSLSSWDTDGNHIDLLFMKRIDDASFFTSEDSWSNYYGDGSPLIKVCTVSGTTVTIGAGSDLGIPKTGTSGSCRKTISDIVMLSSNNAVFVTSSNNATQANYVGLISGTVDLTTRVITYGTKVDLYVGLDTSAKLVKQSSTKVTCFYSTYYRSADVNPVNNVITLTYAQQSHGIVGTSLRLLNSKDDSIGLYFYINASNYLVCGKFTDSGDVITFNTGTVLTTSATTSLLYYLSNKATNEYTIIYTTGGTTKTRRLILTTSVLDLGEVDFGNVSIVNAGVDKNFIYSFDGSSGELGNYYAIIYLTEASNDLSKFLGLSLGNYNSGDSTYITILSSFATCNGLTPNSDIYLNIDGTLTTNKTATSSGITYNNQLIGFSLSSTSLIMKK